MVNIIDPHFHLWDLSIDPHDWLDSAPPMLGKNYLVSDYESETQRYTVRKKVHIQAGWDKKNPGGETAWVNSFADAVIGFVDFSGEKCMKILEQHLRYPNFRGVRQILACETPYMQMELWRKNFKVLAKYNLVFDLQIYAEQADAAAGLVAENPEIDFILEHFMLPRPQQADYFNFWHQQLKKLAAFPNVFLKLSGFGMCDPHWSPDSIRPYIEASVALFGAERCMFASNFPVDKVYKTFDEIYSAYFEVVKNYSIAEKHQLFYNTAEKVYRLSV